MSPTPEQEEKIRQKILGMKSAFSNYNVVRMREALRYMSGPKLSLFIKIPFLIHINLPDMPGFVSQGPAAHGIYKFKDSGFYKEGLKQIKTADTAPEFTSGADPKDPCILGLYHIGSLGTFTQSAQSDFDYWVIIDKEGFNEERYYNLKKKLDRITTYALEEFNQEVTFFIMDQAEIRRDCYAGFNKRETLTAPKLFLKEEFYRTFLMIAGKIPVWTILPPNIKKGTYTALVTSIRQIPSLKALDKEFIDLGKLETPEKTDILRGILWHICKSKEDPVKALIKATMILSQGFGSQEHSGLLCDEMKAKFGDAGIDDYRTDPYKILFDRVIAYHEAHATGSLNLIKNAIFFRLCQYPMVDLPESGSPKKQLLDRYIRAWNLTPSQIKKLLTYSTWSESEKILLERTIVKRLSEMYRQVGRDSKANFKRLDSNEQRNLKILMQKTRERLNLSEHKIQACSTFMARLHFDAFQIEKKKFKGWFLKASAQNDKEERLLYRSSSLLKVIGWLTENRLYRRSKATLKLNVENQLFESRDDPVTPDALYLALQPVKPMSDDVFEFEAQWTKLMVLLGGHSQASGFTRVEFLGINTWGELYEDEMSLDTGRPMPHRYRDIADKIKRYEGKRPQLLFYQLASRRDPEAVYQIKQWLGDRFMIAGPGIPKKKRPLLDKL